MKEVGYVCVVLDVHDMRVLGVCDYVLVFVDAMENGEVKIAFIIAQKEIM